MYGFRWIELVIFCLAAAVNQVAWISMQPVATQVSKTYEQPTTLVNTISLSYQALFVVFTFPSNYVIDVYGPRKGVLLGTLCTTVGMGIKCLINTNFYLVIVG